MLPELMVWMKRALTVFGLGAGVVGIALGLLVSFQEKLIYIPRIPGMRNDFPFLPDAFDMEYEDINITAADGTKLHAWYLSPKGWSASDRRKHPTLIFLQENAGNMAMRLPFLRLVLRYLQCSVLAPSYRGYGLSEGSPNESGLKQDTQAALDYLLTRQDVNPRKLSIMGKSLGGATAIHLAAANPGKFRTVIVENTFTSIEDVAHKVLPVLKYFIGRGKSLNILVRNKWRNYEEIGKIKDTPILLLSSLLDEMLPPQQMRELYTIAKEAGARDLTFVDFEEAHHMDAYEVARQYWPAVMHFFAKHHTDMQLGQNGFDSEEDSTGDFEDIGAEPGVQAMRRAEQPGTESDVTVSGVRARHQGHNGADDRT